MQKYHTSILKSGQYDQDERGAHRRIDWIQPLPTWKVWMVVEMRESKQPRWVGHMRNARQHIPVNYVFASQAGKLGGPDWPHGHTKSYRSYSPLSLPSYYLHISQLLAQTSSFANTLTSAISVRGLFWVLTVSCLSPAIIHSGDCVTVNAKLLKDRSQV